MKTIYLRDDDISFFTPIEKLERLYNRLWNANIPINFAVIPALKGNIRVLNRESAPYDPSIPPRYRGQRYTFPLHKNKELCDFLVDKATKNLIEVCQHGYTHSFHEFSIDDYDVSEHMLKLGEKIMHIALPNVEIETFIAPYDRLSRSAFQALMDHNLNICTHSTSLKGTPFEGSNPHTQHPLLRGKKLVIGDTYFFSHHRTPQECLMLALNELETFSDHDVFLVINHYWAFFYDWRHTWDEMLNAWDQFVDHLLALDDVIFKTFS